MAVEKQLLSSQDASELLGVGEDLFDDLAAEEDWLHPVYLGKGRRRLKRWRRADVLALGQVLAGRTRPRAEGAGGG